MKTNERTARETMHKLLKKILDLVSAGNNTETTGQSRITKADIGGSSKPKYTKTIITVDKEVVHFSLHAVVRCDRFHDFICGSS